MIFIRLVYLFHSPQILRRKSSHIRKCSLFNLPRNVLYSFFFITCAPVLIIFVVYYFISYYTDLYILLKAGYTGKGTLCAGIKLCKMVVVSILLLLVQPYIRF